MEPAHTNGCICRQNTLCVPFNFITLGLWWDYINGISLQSRRPNTLFPPLNHSIVNCIHDIFHEYLAADLHDENLMCQEVWLCYFPWGYIWHCQIYNNFEHLYSSLTLRISASIAVIQWAPPLTESLLNYCTTTNACTPILSTVYSSTHCIHTVYT